MESVLMVQGTDGFSRGDESTGFMETEKIEEFVSLDLSAIQRSSELRPWLAAAAKGLEPIFLLNQRIGSPRVRV
jgi:hypothetical protein